MKKTKNISQKKDGGGASPFGTQPTALPDTSPSSPSLCRKSTSSRRILLSLAAGDRSAAQPPKPESSPLHLHSIPLTLPPPLPHPFHPPLIKRETALTVRPGELKPVVATLFSSPPAGASGHERNSYSSCVLSFASCAGLEVCAATSVVDERSSSPGQRRGSYRRRADCDASSARRPRRWLRSCAC